MHLTPAGVTAGKVRRNSSNYIRPIICVIVSDYVLA